MKVRTLMLPAAGLFGAAAIGYGGLTQQPAAAPTQTEAHGAPAAAQSRTDETPPDALDTQRPRECDAARGIHTECNYL